MAGISPDNKDFNNFLNTDTLTTTAVCVSNFLISRVSSVHLHS